MHDLGSNWPYNQINLEVLKIAGLNVISACINTHCTWFKKKPFFTQPQYCSK